MFFQQIICGSVIRWWSFIIFDEIAKHRIFFVIGWRLEREGTSRHLDHILHLFRWDIQRNGQLFYAWFTTEALSQLVLYTQKLIDLIAHMHRDSDSASLVGNRAGNSLANPP